MQVSNLLEFIAFALAAVHLFAVPQQHTVSGANRSLARDP